MRERENAEDEQWIAGVRRATAIADALMVALVGAQVTNHMPADAALAAHDLSVLVRKLWRKSL